MSGRVTALARSHISTKSEKRLLRFFVIAGADAARAHLDGLDRPAGVDLDILKIDFKSALHIFDDVHTDAAGFLGQTLAGDAAAVGLGFAAHFADFAHFVPHFPGPDHRRAAGFYR